MSLIGFFKYIRYTLMAKIGVLIIPFCLFYLPSDVYLGTLSFMRFIVFLYCVLFAIKLFAIGVKDLIVPTGYLALAVYVQPFYNFWGIYKVGRDHALHLASWGHAYTLQYCGEAMIVLLILSYIEEVSRRR
jgi:hypothetical protein|uniref:Uncharacterized protein n=1 Tax=Myoviridae sp. ctAca11 TaxID=2825043 RepID=A0A8S5Q7G0_9CAUD|nr:MAG TPA: hypothetical protein [Myoviridae sp. ctAca11]